MLVKCEDPMSRPLGRLLSASQQPRACSTVHHQIDQSTGRLASPATAATRYSCAHRRTGRVAALHGDRHWNVCLDQALRDIERTLPHLSGIQFRHDRVARLTRRAHE